MNTYNLHDIEVRKVMHPFSICYIMNKKINIYRKKNPCDCSSTSKEYNNIPVGSVELSVVLPHIFSTFMVFYIQVPMFSTCLPQKMFSKCIMIITKSELELIFYTWRIGQQRNNMTSTYPPIK